MNSAAEGGPAGLPDSKTSPPGGTEYTEVENHYPQGFSCINTLIAFLVLHSEVGSSTLSWGN